MKEGYKDTLIGRIPEEWELVTLSDAGEIISGGTPDTTNPDYWNGHFAWCTPTDITGLKGKRYINNTERYISEEGLNNSSATLLPENSLIICTRATIGDCAMNKVPISTNQGFKSIKPNNDWDVTFLYYFIKANKPVLVKLSSGSTFLEISKSSFEKILIPKPKKSEQSKIASILSTIDDKIDAINERIIRIQQLKNGLIQQLLTKGIGHTTFKDSPLGEIPESWEVKPVKNTLFVKGRIGWRGLKKEEFTEEGAYLITGMHFIGNKIDWGKCFHITEERFLESPEIIVKNDDIIITKDGTIGKVAYISNLPDKASLNSHLFLVRPLDDKINSKFLFFIFLSISFTQFIDKLKTGSTLTGLPQKSFETFSFPVPPVCEQIKISEILSDVDEKLDVLLEKKTEYNKLKSGLMQQLLTGNIRVKV